MAPDAPKKDSGEAPPAKKDALEAAEPKPRTYTPEEIAQISARVEQYTDSTPSYDPQHILSPEYRGTSSYEEGIRLVREETQERLRALQADPEASRQEMNQAVEDLKTLDHLYENYNIGMNVFRTAHGGRSKLRK